jgi:hypothetical protein
MRSKPAGVKGVNVCITPSKVNVISRVDTDVGTRVLSPLRC